MGNEGNVLERVLASSPSKFAFITQNAEQFKFQALLSYVSVDSFGYPTLVRHGYRLDHEYFYPASSIKLCGVVAALYKLQQLRESLGLDISLTTPLAFHPLQDGELLVDHDSSNLIDGTINLAHEIRKTLLVSDNVAFNRLYAFTGQRYINEKMWELGLSTSRIQHRLSVSLNREGNRICEPVDLHVSNYPVTLAPKKNSKSLQSSGDCKGFKLGVGQALENGEVVMEPMDFTHKNSMSLLDLQNLMVKIFRPDIDW